MYDVKKSNASDLFSFLSVDTSVRGVPQYKNKLAWKMMKFHISQACSRQTAENIGKYRYRYNEACQEY
jgi:hypothetical protein